MTANKPKKDPFVTYSGDPAHVVLLVVSAILMCLVIFVIAAGYFH